MYVFEIIKLCVKIHRTPVYGSKHGGENPIKNSQKRVLKNALGDSAERKVTKCHVSREGRTPQYVSIGGFNSPNFD